MTTVKDAITFIETWRDRHSIQPDIRLTQEQFDQFTKDLQSQFLMLGFKSLKAPNASIIPFSGMYGDVPAWKLAKEKAEQSGGKHVFIGNIPAGQLMYDEEFVCAVLRAVGEDEEVADIIINGNRK